jgi:hypothetical protein
MALAQEQGEEGNLHLSVARVRPTPTQDARSLGAATVANGTTVAPALDIRAKEVKTPVNATWMAPAPA